MSSTEGKVCIHRIRQRLSASNDAGKTAAVADSPRDDVWRAIHSGHQVQGFVAFSAHSPALTFTRGDTLWLTSVLLLVLTR